jgi:hypothetical protein
MKPNVTAVEGFELSYKLTSAINTLSLSAKLVQAGQQATATHLLPEDQVKDARIELERFLDRFVPLVEKAQRQDKSPVMGCEPTVQLLAQSYAKEGQRSFLPWRSNMAIAGSVQDLHRLLNSNDPKDRQLLIESLSLLRERLQDTSREQVANVLGDF